MKPYKVELMKSLRRSAQIISEGLVIRLRLKAYFASLLLHCLYFFFFFSIQSSAFVWTTNCFNNIILRWSSSSFKKLLRFYSTYNTIHIYTKSLALTKFIIENKLLLHFECFRIEKSSSNVFKYEPNETPIVNRVLFHNHCRSHIVYKTTLFLITIFTILCTINFILYSRRIKSINNPKTYS